MAGGGGRRLSWLVGPAQRRCGRSTQPDHTPTGTGPGRPPNWPRPRRPAVPGWVSWVAATQLAQNRADQPGPDRRRTSMTARCDHAPDAGDTVHRRAGNGCNEPHPPDRNAVRPPPARSGRCGCRTSIAHPPPASARVRPRPSQPSSRRLGRRRNGNREPAPALFAAAHRAHPGTGPVPQPGTGHCGSYRCGERPGTADRGGTGRPVHRRRREGRPYRRRSTGTGDHRYRGTAARATRYRYRGHRYRPPAHPKPRWSYRPAGRSASPATTAITTRTVTATAAAGLAEHTAVTDPPARVPRRAGGQERRPHYPRPAPSPGSGFRMLSWDVTPSTAAGCGRDRTCPNSPRFPGLPRATAGPDRVPALARRRQIHPPSPCVTGCSAPAGCGTCTPGRPNDCGTTPRYPAYRYRRAVPSYRYR